MNRVEEFFLDLDKGIWKLMEYAYKQKEYDPNIYVCIIELMEKSKQMKLKMEAEILKYKPLDNLNGNSKQIEDLLSYM